MDTADFVVIGGGIAGASAGFELAGLGSVVVLEKESTTGYHTTGRSAAIFTEAYERGPVRLLTMASRAFFRNPPDGFTDHDLLNPLPVLFIARDDQRDAIDEVIASSADLVSLEHAEGARLAELCPVLNDTIVAGALEPDAMEIDVHDLHQGFLGGIRRRGSVVRTSRRVSALDRDGGLWRIRAGEDEIRAPVVVNASGSWADDVSQKAGLAGLGLQPMRRTAFTFTPPDGVDLTGWPITIDVDEQFYFKPERTQIMGSLAEEMPMPPHDVRPEEIDVALAIDRIQAATSLNIRHVGRAWAGLRTFAPDRLPVVGFDPRAEGFFWLAGQGGYGIMTSPAMARATAGLIANGRLPDTLSGLGLTAAALAPDRLIPAVGSGAATMP